MADFYTAWIEEQAKGIAAAMRDYGRKGMFNDVAVYVIPSQGHVPGRLVASHDRPEGATDVVRFPGHGSRVMTVPHSHLQSLLWNACRSFPILPV